MYVNQIAIFLENCEGRISDVCDVLAKAHIDIVTMSIADTNDFGIIRAITRDNQKAIEVLKDAGFVAKSNDLIGVLIKDEAGSLAKVLKTIKDNDINVEYLYSYVRKQGGDDAIILIKTKNPELAIKKLSNAGVSFVENKML